MLRKLFVRALRRGLTRLPLVPDYAAFEIPEDFDFSNYATAYAVIPTAGAGQLPDGSVAPRVFIKILSTNEAGTEFYDTTYSFDPYELGLVANVINTFCMSMVKDPAQVADAIAKVEDGIATKNPKADNYRGYL